MQIFSSRKRKVEAVALLLTLSVAGFIGYQKFSALIPTDPAKVAAIVGPYGPLGIILTQFTQVLVAPLPPVTPVISGMLYGVALGTFYSFIGAALGSLVAIFIGRKYGRAAVEKFLSEEAMEKFDQYTSGHGYLPFLVLFVFPGFPDDALCFIAGLTELSWKKIFVIASLGRIPGIALLAMTGSSVAHANTHMFLVSGATVLAISYCSIKYEEHIEQLVMELEQESLSLIEYFM